MSVSTTKLFFPRKTKNTKTKHDSSVVQNGQDLKGGGDLVGSPPKSEVQTIHIAQAGAGQTGLGHLVKTGLDPYTTMKQDDETSHKSTW